jgi:hypothetical protein
MNNHIHHAGQIDENGNVIDPDNIEERHNGGCVYDIAPQVYQTYNTLVKTEYYYKNEKGEDVLYPEKWKDMSWTELSQYIKPADSERYYYNNLFDHCYPNALATKNIGADGPTYFLSNIIHSSYIGMKITPNDSIVRNNIIYAGDNGWMDEALTYGWVPNPINIYPNIRSAVGIKITNNTFVGNKTGIEYKAGWDGEVKNNIFLDIPEPHHVNVVFHTWEGKGSPWLTGEYLYGDLNENHYYYTDMPLALQQQSYHKLKVENDIYMVEPILKSHSVDEKIDYLPTKYISETYQILTSEKVRSNMLDPENNDFRKKDNAPDLEGVGSGIH